MDLDYVVRKVVSFLLSAGVVLVPAAFAVASLSSALGVDAPALVGSATAAVGLLAAILIPTFQRAIETKVHEAIFAHRYDYRLRLRQLSSELVHVFDERELLRRLGDQLIDVPSSRPPPSVRDDRSARSCGAIPGDAIIDGADAAALRGDDRAHAHGRAEASARPSPAVRRWRWEVVFTLRVKDQLLASSA